MTGILLTLLALLPLIGDETAATWTQWGGPNRNFTTAPQPLAPSWPAAGPTQLWRRPLGDGFSGIVSDGTTLFTTYRDGSNDVAIALNAKDGKTVWEARYDAPFNETCSQRLGAGPRAAPLLLSTRLVAATAGGSLVSLDRRTGAQQWRLDLVPPGDPASKPCGYSTSPVQFKDTIIATAGGKGRGVVAVDSATGKVRWASQDFMNGYSSPIIVDLGGLPHLIVFTAGEVAGLDPETGALAWSVPHPADFGVNVAMPLWGADNLLFVSSAYNGGSRTLRLSRDGTSVRAEELWANKRVRIHFGNAVRIGDRVYASNGDFGAAPFAAVDVKTGDMLWRDRSIARSSLIAAGDQLIILDEEGNLVLAKPADDGLKVLARAQVFTGRSWTAPTLCGTKLYLRDQKEIVALELK